MPTFGSKIVIDNALTEPGYRLVQFHNAFNRNVKVAFGALALLEISSVNTAEAKSISLPTGGEPWGRETRWRSLEQPIKDSARFLAEIGIARAAAAYEDYLVGAKGEFDRAKLSAIRLKTDGTSSMDGLDAILGIEPQSYNNLKIMSDFFTIARNCVVHRSNRASEKLVQTAENIYADNILDQWPKRIGKWKVSLPAIKKGDTIDWRPRHSILGSDVFYRCAMVLDRRLVELMKAEGLVRMAAHWSFFADPTVPYSAKLDGATIVRTQLTNRYLVRDISLAETIDLLRNCDQWDKVRREFDRLYPDGPQTAPAIKRRARKRQLKIV